MTGMAFLPGVAPALPLLFKATLAIVLAWASSAALRRVGAPAAARHMAWLFGIAALLALPVLCWFSPALRLPILPGAEAAAALEMVSAPGVAASADAVGSEPIFGGWRLVFLAVYACGTCALLLRLAAGRRMLARLWRQAEPIGDPITQNLLSLLSSQMGLSRPVSLRVSGAAVVPMTWGTLAPKILLPAEAWGWSLERRRLVLLHELAHIARRDSLSRSAAAIACAVYWFHPGAWFAARGMHLEQELAADDRVLATGASANAYGRTLLHVALAVGGRSQPNLAVAMARPGQLERRLVAMTTPSRRDRPGTAAMSAAGLLAAVGTVVVAAGVPVSASSTVRRPLTPVATVIAPRLQGTDEATAASATAADRAVFGQAADVAAAQPAQGASGGDAEEAPEPSRQSSSRVTASQASDDEEGDRPRQAPPGAANLPDYGWKLPKPSLKPKLGSLSDSSPGAGAKPPFYSASKEEAAGGKKSQILPRLFGSAVQQKVSVSWALESNSPK